MMNGAHASTGLLAGAATTMLACSAGWIDLGSWPSATVATIGYAIICAGFALLPDIDHDRSTVTTSVWWATRLLAKTLQALARGVYRVTGGDTRYGNGEHRGLIHAPIFAILTGAALTAASWITPWVGFAVIVVMLAASVRSLAWEMHSNNKVRLPGPLRRKLARKPIMRAALKLAPKIGYGLRERLGALVLAGIIATSLWGIAGDGLFGWWLGVTATIGMIVHSMDDSVTKGGIPWLAPITWRKFRLPYTLTYRVGSEEGQILEKWIARLCLVFTAAILTTGMIHLS